MKILIMLLVLFSISGCLPEENCYQTDEIVGIRTKQTEFYTISEPVYKMECE